MKKLWLIFQTFLLALAVASWVAGADNLFGVVVTIIIVLSFPLNLLFGWLFFAFDSVIAMPELMLLMAFVMSAASYLQWFEIVPRMGRYFGRKLSRLDSELELAWGQETLPLIEARVPQHVREWSTQSDQEKYSPIERVFIKETESSD